MSSYSEFPRPAAPVRADSWLSPAAIAMIDADALHVAHQIRQAAAQGASFSMELAEELEAAARLIRLNNDDPLADLG